MHKEHTWRKGTGQRRQAIIRSKAQPEEKIDETQTLRKKNTQAHATIVRRR